MKIICVSTLKGGVGKSNLVFQMGGMLAEQGYKVLLIDADPQANTTTNVGIYEEDENYLSLVDAFERKVKPEEIVIKTPIESLPSLDILPSSVYLTATEFSLVTRNARELVFRKYIKENEDFFKQYNYIIIDTNPNIGLINQNMLVVSNSIILVTDISFNGYKGCELFYKLWNDIASDLEIKNNIKGFVVNKYDKRVKLSEQFLEFCKNNDLVKDIMLHTYIPDNIKIRESEISKIPLCMYDKKNKGYEAYKNLYNELFVRGVI